MPMTTTPNQATANGGRIAQVERGPIESALLDIGGDGLGEVEAGPPLVSTPDDIEGIHLADE
jgi:hypothetical protein